jgi:tripartite-type tricarboxylate transporter receptor subunit TctC
MFRHLRRAEIGVLCVTWAALALYSAALYPPVSIAQTYPAKPIRIIVTSTPGSGPDIVARLIGGKLTEAWGQQVIVDDRAGASGRIGAEAAAASAPDGYTLMILTSQLTIVDGMYEKLKYSLVRDFAPVSMLGATPFILVTNPSVPANSIKELVALAKSKPGTLQYGSGGSGSPPHLSAEIFKFMTGTDILHVPYKGSPLAMTGAMTGEVHMSFSVIPQALPMIKSGKLKALGVTSAERTTLVPDLPAISESVPGYEFIGWYGLLAPAKTPPAILAKLNAEVVKVLNAPAIKERMAGLGIEALGSSQQDFAVYIRTQLEKMREAVKLSGARPED